MWKSTLRLSFLSIVAMAAAASWQHDADAVVLQIDGTIVPQATGNIQPGLNKGENGAPYTNTATPPTVAGAGAKGPISPVFDAAEQPQVFAVPRLANNSFGAVTFIDLLEGAGYGKRSAGTTWATISRRSRTCTPC